MIESAKQRLIEAEARGTRLQKMSNASPEGIRERLLDAQALRVEAEGAANKAQVTLDSGKKRRLTWRKIGFTDFQSR